MEKKIFGLTEGFWLP